jgi:hypothetical protein
VAILDQVEEAGHVDVGGFINREKLGRVLSTSRSFEGKTFLTAGTYDAYRAGRASGAGWAGL